MTEYRQVPGQPVEIRTANPPVCKLCRERRFQTWNSTIGPGPRVQRAEVYVQVRGTERFRHICLACQQETGDEIMARFLAPQED